MSEVKLVVQRGPRTGLVFRLPPAQVRVLGSGEGLQWRLPELARRAAVFRLGRRLELQLLCEGSLKGRPCAVGAWVELREGDRLALGPHVLGVVISRPSVKPEPPPGFVIERELGRGGFGVVYAARRESDGLRVALKVLQWARPSHLERFRREGATCLGLDHPSIVRVLELGVDETPPWITLDYVEGEDAAALLTRGPLSIERALEIGADLASALTWLHARELVHRDVKLQNVLVPAEGPAKLTDFGLVKDLSCDLVDLTKSGVTLGTLVYAAPEQMQDAKAVASASDVYSLGVTLFGLLCGRLPWTIDSGKDPAAALSAPALELQSLRPDVPNVLAALVRSTLRRDPTRRPSASDLERLLRQLL